MHLLGIDIGSSSTKAVVIDEQGNKLFSFHEPLTTYSPDKDRFEQDPEEIWRSALSAIKEAQAKVGKVDVLGICCQRSAVTAWKGEQALSPLITWRDSRLLSTIEKLRSNAAILNEKSGLPLTVHYAATKIAALQKQFPDAAVGTLDTYLCNRLTGNFLSDETSAAGSMLYNLETRDWDFYLCAIFDCEIKRLAPIKRSISNFGSFQGIPLLSVSGDQQAVGYALSDEGQSPVLSLGTIAAFILSTGSAYKKEAGFITRVGWSKDDSIRYLIEGTVNSCGAAFDLIMKDRSLAASYDQLEEQIRRADGICQAFLPFGGTPSPEWRRDLPFVISNWRGADSDQLCKAIIEGLGGFIVQLIERMNPACSTPIHVTGGAASSRYLLEFISACLGRELLLEEGAETGAEGAALMAAQGLGVEVKRNRDYVRVSSQDQEMQCRYKEWLKFKDQIEALAFPEEWRFPI